MSANTDETLVRMANQIATFFASQPEAEQLDGVISHINRFWERRMRERLLQLSTDKQAHLHELVARALPQIKA